MDLVDAVAAPDGCTCVVGAGGKKTTLYALAGRLDRAVLTATVRIPIFDREVAAVAVADDPVAALSDHGGGWPLGLVAGRDRSDRYRGYDPAVVDDLAAAHDGPTLVKADGARTREFKAPNDREPQVPAGADVVLPIASIHAVGHPLDESTVHRPERVAALTDLTPGEEITPAAVAAVLAHPEGGLKRVPEDATVRVLLNKADDDADAAVGREIARELYARTDRPERVVLARTAEPAVVETLEAGDV